MTKDEIFNGLVETLEKNFEVPKEKVTLQSNIFQDLDIDSIDAIDLLINLKKLTGKQISPEVFKQVQTVGDVVDALYAEVNK